MGFLTEKIGYHLRSSTNFGRTGTLRTLFFTKWFQELQYSLMVEFKQALPQASATRAANIAQRQAHSNCISLQAMTPNRNRLLSALYGEKWAPYTNMSTAKLVMLSTTRAREDGEERGTDTSQEFKSDSEISTTLFLSPLPACSAGGTGDCLRN